MTCYYLEILKIFFPILLKSWTYGLFGHLNMEIFWDGWYEVWLSEIVCAVLTIIKQTCCRIFIAKVSHIELKLKANHGGQNTAGENVVRCGKRGEGQRPTMEKVVKVRHKKMVTMFSKRSTKELVYRWWQPNWKTRATIGVMKNNIFKEKW